MYDKNKRAKIIGNLPKFPHQAEQEKKTYTTSEWLNLPVEDRKLMFNAGLRRDLTRKAEDFILACEMATQPTGLEMAPSPVITQGIIALINARIDRLEEDYVHGVMHAGLRVHKPEDT